MEDKGVNLCSMTESCKTFHDDKENILNVEIYPYHKHRRPHIKTIDLDSICNKTELIDYTQKQYINIFKAEDIKPIIKEVLKTTMNITGSKSGYLSIVSNDERSFEYYSIIIDIDGFNLSTDSNLIAKTIVDIRPGSLISRPYISGDIVISNDITKDPRAMGSRLNIKHPNHPPVEKYLGIPLKENSKIIGQLGLANSDKYTVKDIENISPIIYFFQNFVHLVRNNNEISLSQELKLKVKSSELKDTFIASMSHEMRTPLNGIIGMSRLLSESDHTNLTEKQEKYINVINECGTQLLELVNDVLDFSKISSGELTLHLHSFNLKKCIEAAVSIVKDKIESKNLEFKLDINGLPDMVNGDSRRIKQILINLLSNSIKFTEAGYISLKAKAEDLEGFKKKIILQVEDSGIGIKEDDCEKIFSVFTKATNNKVYSYDNPGAGLGLAINRELCRLMDGDITVESVYGSGSIFTAIITVDDETYMDISIKDNEKLLKNKKIIAVDDNVDNRMFIIDTLTPWGLDVTAFGSARETLKYVETKDFDVIIIDICMPGMNGIELVQKLREKNFKQPMIGLSSLGSRSGDTWFDYFFIKPISKSDLYNILIKSLKEKPEENKLRRVSGSKGKDMKILLAEDDYYSQVLFREMLEVLGYKNLTVVNNGRECVDAIKRENWDICFMDIKMPVMDGMEATREIKKISVVPIVAVSASVLEKDKQMFQYAGMDGYIPKPIDKDRLESILSNR